MDKFVSLFKSRKFWAALVGLVLITVRAYSPEFPFSENEVIAFIGVLASYIFGVGLEDSAKK
jgi:hypothetical protein